MKLMKQSVFEVLYVVSNFVCNCFSWMFCHDNFHDNLSCSLNRDISPSYGALCVEAGKKHLPFKHQIGLRS